MEDSLSFFPLSFNFLPSPPFFLPTQEIIKQRLQVERTPRKIADGTTRSRPSYQNFFRIQEASTFRIAREIWLKSGVQGFYQVKIEFLCLFVSLYLRLPYRFVAVVSPPLPFLRYFFIWHLENVLLHLRCSSPLVTRWVSCMDEFFCSFPHSFCLRSPFSVFLFLSWHFQRFYSHYRDFWQAV